MLGCRTCAKLLAHADIGDVGDADGNAAAIGDDDRFEVVDPGRLARHTDQILLAIALDIAGADIGVVAIERIDHIVEGQAIGRQPLRRSEEHTSELQSLMRSSYAVFCLKKKKK